MRNLLPNTLCSDTETTTSIRLSATVRIMASREPSGESATSSTLGSFPYTSRGAVQPVGAANAAANAKRATADPANFFLCNTRTSLQSPGLPGMLAGVFAKHEHKTIGFAQTRRCVRHQGALVLRPARQVAP